MDDKLTRQKHQARYTRAHFVDTCRFPLVFMSNRVLHTLAGRGRRPWKIIGYASK